MVHNPVTLSKPSGYPDTHQEKNGSADEERSSPDTTDVEVQQNALRALFDKFFGTGKVIDLDCC